MKTMVRKAGNSWYVVIPNEFKMKVGARYNIEKIDGMLIPSPFSYEEEWDGFCAQGRIKVRFETVLWLEPFQTVTSVLKVGSGNPLEF